MRLRSGYDESMPKEKIAITLEASTLAQVKDLVRSRKAASVSAYISDAVAARLEADSMGELVKELVREQGQPSRGARAWARKVLGRLCSTREPSSPSSAATSA
jgi:hypothetical protein